MSKDTVKKKPTKAVRRGGTAPSVAGSTDSPHCANCPLRCTGAFTKVTSAELAFIEAFRHGNRLYKSGAEVIRENSTDGRLYTVFAGWAFRYKTLSDGRRQILSFLLPGDFTGLQQHFGEGAAYGVEAVTDVSLCVFPQDGLMDLFRRIPSLGFDMTWLAVTQENVIDENLLTTGRRNAPERVAMLLVYLYQRAERVGLATGGAISFPLNQQHIADALGLSLVHTNKTLRRLQKMGLYTLEDGRLRLLNPKALERIADYVDRPSRAVPLL